MDDVNQYATFWRRSGAALVDMFILTVPYLIACSHFDASSSKNAGFLFYFLAILYCTVFESSPLQATPGKLLFGIIVTDISGNRIGLFRAFWRSIYKTVFAFGFIACLFTKRRQALHDLIYINPYHWTFNYLADITLGKIPFLPTLVVKRNASVSTHSIRSVKNDAPLSTQSIESDKYDKYTEAGNEASKQGQYAKAEKSFSAALEEAERFGPENTRFTTSVNNLAELYITQGKYAEAELLYKRSLQTMEQALGPNHVNVYIIVLYLAILYSKQGRDAEVEPLRERALQIAEAIHGPNHLDIVPSLDNLAGFYSLHKRYAEAERLYVRSLQIEEQTLGPNDPRVATTSASLAFAYFFQEKYAEAEPRFKRSLAIRERAYGPDDPVVATSLESYCVLLRRTNREAEASKLEIRAKAIMAKSGSIT